jgi:hypothetical protein
MPTNIITVNVLTHSGTFSGGFSIAEDSEFSIAEGNVKQYFPEYDINKSEQEMFIIETFYGTQYRYPYKAYNRDGSTVKIYKGLKCLKSVGFVTVGKPLGNDEYKLRIQIWEEKDGKRRYRILNVFPVSPR